MTAPNVVVTTQDGTDDPPRPEVEVTPVDDPALLRAALDQGRATLRHIIDHGQSGPEIDAAVHGVVAAVQALHDLTFPLHATRDGALRAWRVEMAKRTKANAAAAIADADATIEAEG